MALERAQAEETNTNGRLPWGHYLLSYEYWSYVILINIE